MSQPLFPPTRRQARLLAYIREYIAREGQAPLMREMASAIGSQHHSAARSALLGLQARGYVRMHPGFPRNVVLLDDQRA